MIWIFFSLWHPCFVENKLTCIFIFHINDFFKYNDNRKPHPETQALLQENVKRKVAVTKKVITFSKQPCGKAVIFISIFLFCYNYYGEITLSALMCIIDWLLLFYRAQIPFLRGLVVVSIFGRLGWVGGMGYAQPLRHSILVFYLTNHE